MTDIDALTQRVHTLSAALDRWNGWMILALIGAAVVALAIGITTRMAIVRAKQLSDAQAELLRLKDNQVRTDLADKQIKIDQAVQAAAVANARAESERTARVRLEQQLVARRLTGAQKQKLTAALKTQASAVVIVSTILDGESGDYADDFDQAIKTAGWQTLRIRNHISEKTGIQLGTVNGVDLPGLRALSEALHALGVHPERTAFSTDDHSISPYFQAGVIYLVVLRQPPPNASPAE